MQTQAYPSHYQQQPSTHPLTPTRQDHQLSFFPIAPYVFRTAAHEERWTSEVSCCHMKAFDTSSKPSQTFCYALLKALSEDSRFVIRRTARAEDESLAVTWHVPGYWLLTSRSGVAWVRLFEFGCFVLDINVPSNEATVCIGTSDVALILLAVRNHVEGFKAPLSGRLTTFRPSHDQQERYDPSLPVQLAKWPQERPVLVQGHGVESQWRIRDKSELDTRDQRDDAGGKRQQRHHPMLPPQPANWPPNQYMYNPPQPPQSSYPSQPPQPSQPPPPLQSLPPEHWRHAQYFPPMPVQQPHLAQQHAVSVQQHNRQVSEYSSSDESTASSSEETYSRRREHGHARTLVHNRYTTRKRAKSSSPSYDSSSTPSSSDSPYPERRQRGQNRRTPLDYRHADVAHNRTIESCSSGSSSSSSSSCETSSTPSQDSELTKPRRRGQRTAAALKFSRHAASDRTSDDESSSCDSSSSLASNAEPEEHMQRHASLNNGKRAHAANNMANSRSYDDDEEEDEEDDSSSPSCSGSSDTSQKEHLFAPVAAAAAPAPRITHMAQSQLHAGNRRSPRPYAWRRASPPNHHHHAARSSSRISSETSSAARGHGRASMVSLETRTTTKTTATTTNAAAGMDTASATATLYAPSPPPPTLESASESDDDAANDADCSSSSIMILGSVAASNSSGASHLESAPEGDDDDAANDADCSSSSIIVLGSVAASDSSGASHRIPYGVVHIPGVWDASSGCEEDQEEAPLPPALRRRLTLPAPNVDDEEDEEDEEEHRLQTAIAPCRQDPRRRRCAWFNGVRSALGAGRCTRRAAMPVKPAGTEGVEDEDEDEEDEEEDKEEEEEEEESSMDEEVALAIVLHSMTNTPTSAAPRFRSIEEMTSTTRKPVPLSSESKR